MALALSVSLLAGGCIPRRPVSGEELNRYWYLSENVFASAKPQPLAIGPTPLPSTWVFRREESLIWSTVSIVRAADRLRDGAEEIELANHDYRDSRRR